MTKYFYIDADGEKQGPVSKQQIIELAEQGIILPTTPIGTKDRYISEVSQLREKPGFFDIGFTRFISNIWISIIWAIVIVVHFFGFILLLIGTGMIMASGDSKAPVAALSLSIVILGTAGLSLSLLFCRMALELDVILFRIETNTRESKEYLREIKELLAQK